MGKVCWLQLSLVVGCPLVVVDTRNYHFQYFPVVGLEGVVWSLLPWSGIDHSLTPHFLF